MNQSANSTESPTPAKSHRTRKPLVCPYCSLVFKRPSHLTRHISAHLSPGQRSHVACSECRKQFTRNDVLLRHLRTTHNISCDSQRSVQKSCFRCASKKLKCDRNYPCQSCARSEADCVYRDDNNGPLSSLDALLLKRHSKEGGTACSYNQVPKAANENEIGGSNLTQSRIAENSIDSRLRETDALGVNATPCPYTAAESQISLGPSSHYTPSTIFTSSACTNYEATLFSDDNEALFSPGLSFGSSQEVFNPTIFGGLTQDWLDFDLLDPLGGFGDPPTPSTFAAHLIPSYNDSSTNNNPNMLAPIHHISYSRPNQANETSVSSRTTMLPPQNPSQQWPFEQTQEDMRPQLQLPSLRDMLRGSGRPHGLDKATMESLARLLSEPVLPKIDDSPITNLTPALRLLKKGVDAYFSHFCAILPIVHIPTWDMFKSSTILVAAMACIGVMFIDDPEAWEKSLSLSDICARMIVWLGESDPTKFHDASYLSACCLHQIYSLGSGNRSLYQSADRSRGMLIGSLRGMGLLRPQLSIDQDADDKVLVESMGTKCKNSHNLQTEWLKWRNTEVGRRLAWASFEYDCSLCTLTNRRGNVDLNELPTHLPCSDALWQASSAAAWKALILQSPPEARGARLSNLLRQILSASPFSPDLTSWGRRLCAQIIGRLLWDLKEMQFVWMSNCLGLSSLHSAQRQTASSLLQAFGSLTRSMTQASSMPELVDYNIGRLIYHYSYLYSAEDILDLVVFIVRGTTTIAANDHTAKQLPYTNADLLVAKRHLTAKFSSDPRRTRKLAWHAAQIATIANVYLVQAPCEILRIFMGYIFIMAFARYGTHSPPGDSISENAAPVRLDLTDTTQSHHKAVARWIEQGGPASLASIENVCSSTCVGTINEQAQALLQELHCWGLVEKFSKILELFWLNEI